MSVLVSHREGGPEGVKPLRIVVLDDDRFDRKRLSRHIHAASGGSAQVEEAADLDQFTQALSGEAVDLVFIDYRLADGDGADAMEVLLQSARSAGAYAVMVSGVQDAWVDAVALDAGCDRFLMKSALSGEVIAQSIADARGVLAEPVRRKVGTPSSAIEFWAARARRRQSPVPVARPRQSAKAEPSQKKADVSIYWEGDWTGSNAFFNDLMSDDEFEFEHFGIWPDPR